MTITRRAESDLGPVAGIVAVLGFAVFIGVMCYKHGQETDARWATRQPVNPASVNPGDVVYLERNSDTSGTVIKVIPGGAEGPAKVTLRIHAYGSNNTSGYSEVTFLDSELWQGP